MIKQKIESEYKIIHEYLQKLKISPHHIILCILLIAGFILRIEGIDFGLPQHFHPDETPLISHGFQILSSGDLNPHFFAYPSLLIYINAIIFGLYLYLHGSIISYEQYLIARLIVAVFGTGIIALTYLIGKELFNSKTGIIAATIFTVLPLAVNDSHYGTVDIPLTFFITLSILCTYYLIQKGTVKWYVICGICIGLTTATKYSGGLLALVLLIAFIVRLKFQFHINSGNFFRVLYPNELSKLCIAYAMMMVSFFLATPYVILENNSSLKDILYESTHLTEGHGNLFINTSIGYIYHLKTSLYTGLTPPILLLCFLGIFLLVLSVFSHPREAKKIIAVTLIFSWIIPYYCIAGSWEVKFARYVIPLLPLLSICAAYAVNLIIEKILEYLKCSQHSHKLPFETIVSAIVVFSVIISPICTSINVDNNFKTEDTRTASLNWIDSNIPYNSKIIWQVFGPDIFLLNKYYEKSVFPDITQEDLKVRPDFLIFNSYSYGMSLYYPSELGEYPQKRDNSKSEKEYFRFLNNSYTLIKEFYPSQVGDIHPYGVPISKINGTLTGPIIKIYMRNL